MLALKPNSTALAAWRVDGHPCAGGGWPGVTCGADLLVTRLDLHGNRLSGDLAPLAALSALSYLNLAATGVDGDVAALAPLELSDLNLNGTAAEQRVALLALKPAEDSATLAAWRAGGHLCTNGGWKGVTCGADLLVTRLDLHGVRLGGDLSPLAGLITLSYIDLADTGVEGDAGALAQLSELWYLDLNGTAATGWPLATACCTFSDAAHPYCASGTAPSMACQRRALLAFKVSVALAERQYIKRAGRKTP
jgi:hypothetical protein